MKKNLIKKLTSISLCAMLAFSGSVAVCAVNTKDIVNTLSSDTAPKEITIEDCYKYYSCTKLGKPKPLDEETKLKVTDDFLVSLNSSSGIEESTRDDVTIEYYGTLDDGSLLVKAYSSKINYTCVVTHVPLDEYIYVFSGAQEVFIYKDNHFYSIAELYSKSMLTQKDINDLHLLLNLERFKTKSDIRTLFMSLPVGDTDIYTPETAQRYNDAFNYARQIYESENPTIAECTKAYFDLELSSRSLVSIEIDRSALENCYYYARSLSENFGDILTEKDKKFITEIETASQQTLLFPQNEEYFYRTSDEINQKLLDYKFTTDNPDIYSYADFLKIKEFAQTTLDNDKPDDFTKTFISTPFFIDFNGYRLISAHYNIEEPMPITKRVNGYILERNSRSLPSEFGYLVINPDTGDVITLEKALEDGIVKADRLFGLSLDFKMYMLGDADNDGEITVKDATEIQKAGVGLSETVNTATGLDTVFDYNSDGRVSILDVTAIQKKIASII